MINCSDCIAMINCSECIAMINCNECDQLQRVYRYTFLLAMERNQLQTTESLLTTVERES